MSTNVVLEMTQSVRERAEELNGQQAALDEARVIYGNVKHLGQQPGWADVQGMIEAEIATLRIRFEKPDVDAIALASLRGQIEALRWLSQLPGLAEVMLFSLNQQQDAHNADVEDFIENGAK